MAQKNGGPPQVCANLALQLSEFHDVTIASYSSREECSETIPDCPVQTKQVFPFDLFEKVTGMRSQRQIRANVEDADFLHLHNVWEPILLAAGKLAKVLGKRYTITPHGMLDPWCMAQKSVKKRLALKLGRRNLIESSTFIHALNKAEADGIRKLGIRNRCEIIPNGVNLNAIDPYLLPDASREAFPILGEDPFILFISRLHYKKGLDILGKAAGHFFKSCPDWRWAIVGPDDGAEQEFRSIIDAQGCSDRVHILGPVYGNMKFSLLAAASIFCLPSRQEGFSVAILEALAAKKPVCITENCHFPEVGEAGCGIIDPLDPETIGDSLIQLANSKSAREEMGASGRKLVETKYTWQQVCQQFVALASE